MSTTEDELMDDVLRLHREKCDMYERAIKAELELKQALALVERLAASLRGFVSKDAVLDDCDCEDCKPINEALALLGSLPDTSTESGRG
jgi:hypothetical protein